jgi:hypothetical protein
VLTAQHCVAGLPAAAAQISFGPSVEAARLRTAAIEIHDHPALDLAVLILGVDPGEHLDVVPLRVGEAGLASGALVQLAGYGFDAGGSAGVRRFSVAEVAESDAAELIVTSHGYGGACNGDSGGPALWRGADGEVTVVGVLSKGSVSCFGIERYLRTQPVSAWLAQWVPASTEPERGSRVYEEIDPAGRCFEQTAVWLDAMALAAEPCSEPQVCGWSGAAQGYRCIERSDDACAGRTTLGVCAGTTASRCLRGQLHEDPCAACGLECARSPLSGQVACAAPAEGAE